MPIKMEYELKKLFNLTYEGKQYVSTIAPTNYPVDNYSFIEITYNEELVIHVKGEYIWQGKKEEILLSDLDFFSYLQKQNFKDKSSQKQLKLDIEFMGLTEEQQPKNKIQLLFILSVCSYLVYFHFRKLPYELSLDLLDHAFIKIFNLNVENNNLLFETWNIQVLNFGKTFGHLFSLKSTVETLEISNNIDSIKDHTFVNPDFSHTFVKDNEKTKLEKYIKKMVKKYVEKELQLALHKLEEEAEVIAKEMKEYKRRFMVDISKHDKFQTKL